MSDLRKQMDGKPNCVMGKVMNGKFYLMTAPLGAELLLFANHRGYCFASEDKTAEMIDRGLNLASTEDREMAIRNAGILSELIRKNGVVNGVFYPGQINSI